MCVCLCLCLCFFLFLLGLFVQVWRFLVVQILSWGLLWGSSCCRRGRGLDWVFGGVLFPFRSVAPFPLLTTLTDSFLQVAITLLTHISLLTPPNPYPPLHPPSPSLTPLNPLTLQVRLGHLPPSTVDGPEVTGCLFHGSQIQGVLACRRRRGGAG